MADVETKVDDVTIPTTDIDVVDCTDLVPEDDHSDTVGKAVLAIGTGAIVGATLIVEHVAVPLIGKGVKAIKNLASSQKDKIKQSQAEKKAKKELNQKLDEENQDTGDES